LYTNERPSSDLKELNSLFVLINFVNVKLEEVFVKWLKYLFKLRKLGTFRIFLRLYFSFLVIFPLASPPPPFRRFSVWHLPNLKIIF
jgi:hypothetical protein